MLWKLLKAGLVYGSILYLAFVGLLYIFQRSFIYHPSRTFPVPEESGFPEFETVSVSTQDGLTLKGWYLPPSDPEKPVLLWFQGNAGTAANRAPFALPYREKHGYGVLLAGYRGYSGNPGSPSEQGLCADARAWVSALSEIGIPPSRTILYGESLGSGVATQMAIEHPDMAALILEAPYESLPAVARRTYFFVPVDLLMKDRFDTLSKIGSLSMPLLIVHGMEDTLIPPRMGVRLHELAPDPKTLALFPEAGHSPLPNRELVQTVHDFLERHLHAAQK